MGGGSAMRAAAKVAGIGAFAGKIRGGGAAESPVATAVRMASAGGQTGSNLKVEQAAVQRPAWEIDEWEFTDGCVTEERESDLLVFDRVEPPVQPRVVFGPVPTLEEAKEATHDLKEALDKVYLSSPKSSGSVNSLSSFQDTKACITHEPSAPKSAIQAFMLLKENPAAQTVVASIASDPNVWNAVMQNPTLMEFLEQEKKVTGSEPEAQDDQKDFAGSSETEGAQKPCASEPYGLMAFYEDVKVTVLDMVNNLSDFVQSLFADPSAEKKSESSDGTTKNILAGGSFMALAMMVIMVVLMKRG